MKRILTVLFVVGLMVACSDEQSSVPCATEFERACTCESGASGQFDCSGTCVCDGVSDMSTSEDLGADASATDAGSDLSSSDMSSTDMGDSSSDSGNPDGGRDDMGASIGPGACQTDDDCANGVCRPVADNPLSWRVCVRSVSDPTTCDEGELSLDECCNSTECTQQADGQCTRGPLFYCGGAAPTPANECVYGACTSDSDCTGEGVGVCVDAGVWGERNERCVYGDCRVDSDCSTRTGGECRPFFGACANRFVGLFCTYEDSTCRVDADCPPDGGLGEPTCVPGDDGVTSCEYYLPPP